MMHKTTLILTIVSVMLLAACGPKADPVPEGMLRLTFQSDWFAQPEYAGFYQALATGRYAERGLDVILREGGPNADPLKRLLLKRCDLMNIRSDDAIVARARGLPVRFVGITMQHNPQGILSHAEHAINDFSQLDGKRVMVDVGAPWIDYIERKFDIRIVRMPHNFGLSHYLNDKEFVMQCFITNEPFFARKQGADPHVLPMWESGFDAYRGILVHEDTLKEHPEAIRAFVEATLEAWHEYLYENPDPAHQLIAERNPQMTPELMTFIRDSMLRYGIIDGFDRSPDNIGRPDPRRLQSSIEDLVELGVIEKTFDYSELFTILAP